VSTRRIGTALLSGVATLAGLHSSAAAYDFESCGGGNIKKWQSTIYLRQNYHSIESGSPREGAYIAAKARWNNVGAMVNMLGTLTYPPSFGSTLYNDDLYSDVYFTSSIAGPAVGRELSMSDGCEIVVTDVEIEAGFSSGNPSETALGTYNRATLVHEFGHSLGLDHDEGFNMMRELGALPLIGGTGEHVDVLPDDALGGRILYPQAGFETNLFSSAHLRTSGNVITRNTGAGPVYSCMGGGGQLTVNATVGNNGSTHVTQDERWYVSTNSSQYGGTPIGTWFGSTFNAHSAITRLVTLTMPALPVGTYYLFHKVDTFGTINESVESDNVAREYLTIQVIQC
jgi:hypothetical protein